MVTTMEHNMSTRTIKASEFKAKCLKLMDEVNASGETLTVTKNGKPVVEVRPAVRKRRTLLGLHKGLGETRGDIIGPVLEDDWEAFR
jgi:prevent-host-death family protein